MYEKDNKALLSRNLATLKIIIKNSYKFITFIDAYNEMEKKRQITGVHLRSKQINTIFKTLSNISAKFTYDQPY